MLREPETALKINAVFLFRILGENGGLFHLDFKTDLVLSHEEKPSDCELEITDRDFIKLYKGVLPGFKAVLSGKLKVKGDLSLATKLQDIFRQARKKKSPQ